MDSTNYLIGFAYGLAAVWGCGDGDVYQAQIIVSKKAFQSRQIIVFFSQFLTSC